MNISEIYRSIQGESTYAGLPCTFIRTAGCRLRCVYCDTDYALLPSAGKEISLDVILTRARNVGLDLVEITGGEPLEQTETSELCQRLLHEGAKVLIETSGAYSIAPLPKETVKIMDIKTPASRMEKRNHWDNFSYLQPWDELKFVLMNREDFDWSVNLCQQYNLFNRFTIHFSPAFVELEADTLAKWILEEKIPVRLQLQLHKFIWSSQKRGV